MSNDHELTEKRLAKARTHRSLVLLLCKSLATPTRRSPGEAGPQRLRLSILRRDPTQLKTR